VLLLFVFWMLVLIGVGATAPIYEPDLRKANLDVQWLLAAMFLAYAASVYVVAWYRRTHPHTYTDNASLKTVTVPDADEFMWVRLEPWSYFLLAVAAAIAGATWLGRPLFMT
jgi:hypothetical protein